MPAETALAEAQEQVRTLTEERDYLKQQHALAFKGLVENGEEADAAEATLSRLREALEPISELLDAMETCHICSGTLIIEDGAAHCEDCSYDCDEHEGDPCNGLYALHLSARRSIKAALSLLDPVASDGVSKHKVPEDAARIVAAEQRNRELEAALRSLRNEIVGQLGIAREEIRAAISTTNLRCLERRIEQAEAALSSEKSEPQDNH